MIIRSEFYGVDLVWTKLRTLLEGLVHFLKNFFSGERYLDIREYYNGAEGLMPGRKGVMLKREQWNAFRDAFFDIDEKCVSSLLSGIFKVVV